MLVNNWVNVPLHRIGDAKKQERWGKIILQYAMVNQKWTRINEGGE
jgi:hypothetical protein